MRQIADYQNKSALENVTEALALAKQASEYNAFISLTERRALERAKLVDAGTITGKLAGVPFAVKDNFLAFGAPTTAASKMLESFEAPFQATAVEKLEAEGAICIGKTNLDSFAHGGSTENSFFGPTKNSRDKTCVAGGSSGGSAVAVALDIVPFTLGSDTGGSIRQPASFNGVIGVKPTYGAVSRYGVVAMASSTDTIGCFTNAAQDAETVLAIIAGDDPNDSTTLPDFFVSTELKTRLKIGIIGEQLSDAIDPAVKTATEDYVSKLRAAGHQVEIVSVPTINYALEMYYVIVSAETSSNMARFDGIRYGFRADQPQNLHDLYLQSRSQGFETETKRRILTGSFVLSSGFYEAYYEKAQKVRTLLVNDFERVFKDYDLLLGPTVPTPAFKLGERTSDPVAMYLADVMTTPASMAGLPAVSVPAGLTDAGLTVGVQLTGPQRSDALILSLIKSLEGEV